MILEKESFLCFCAHFDLEKVNEFSKKLTKYFEDNKTTFNITEELDPMDYDLEFQATSEVNSDLLSYKYEIKIRKIEKLIEKYQEVKEMLLKNPEKAKKSEKELGTKINEVDEFIKELEAKKKPLPLPKASVKFEIQNQKKIDEKTFQKAIKDNPEHKFFDLINKILNTEFRCTLCAFIYLNKEDYSLYYESELFFQKELQDKIGTLSSSKIILNIEESPFGIGQIALGESKKKINVDMRIEFKSGDISNIVDKYNFIMNMIRTFIQEEE
ncbi:hypothetical protein LCGC14_1817150 [marine sediment metagenome]|uniref:Uncharacterized protein n=1 Tax=marine sediment metagenome TaxID=412755 RepID=A0A0F9GK15_9ZZZZ|nr:hypothetical protein [bacterium]